MSTSPSPSPSQAIAAAVRQLVAAATDLERCFRSGEPVGPYDAGRADECLALAAELEREVESVAQQGAAESRAADAEERERRSRRGWESLRGLFDAALALARLALPAGAGARSVVERSLAASDVLLVELRTRASRRESDTELELELRLLDAARDGVQSLVDRS